MRCILKDGEGQEICQFKGSCREDLANKMIKGIYLNSIKRFVNKLTPININHSQNSLDINTRLNYIRQTGNLVIGFYKHTHRFQLAGKTKAKFIKNVMSIGLKAMNPSSRFRQIPFEMVNNNSFICIEAPAKYILHPVKMSFLVGLLRCAISCTILDQNSIYSFREFNKICAQKKSFKDALKFLSDEFSVQRNEEPFSNNIRAELIEDLISKKPKLFRASNDWHETNNINLITKPIKYMGTMGLEYYAIKTYKL